MLPAALTLSCWQKAFLSAISAWRLLSSASRVSSSRASCCAVNLKLSCRRSKTCTC